ncbi:hypothetical protein [Aurantiacibacter gilvus]|uniref:Uncharacterized protein n=1 Tax=Aurantiacibacter gilvus TaxID=3139141 RepID=A0ABU9I9M3_9SPHN
MPDPSEIAADPRWLPHRIDAGQRRVQFVRIERARLAEPAFLADIDADSAAEQAWLSFDDVMALEPVTGPLHFIFHTAFCRSTLLVRALEMPGVAAGLSEPAIIAQLYNAGASAQPLIKPVLDLLSRPWAEGEAVFVKPTNHANMLIPALLAARPDASALLMTNPLAGFLKSVARRGLLGRRWGRQLYLELMGYAGMDLGMDAREQFSMTDMQAAGLAWFLSQRWFAMQQEQFGKARLRVLDGDRFDGERAETIARVFEHAGHAFDAAHIESVVGGPLFSKHAKLGSDFADGEAQGSGVNAAPVPDEEIGQVRQWVEMIARQAGVTVPLPQDLA